MGMRYTIFALILASTAVAHAEDDKETKRAQDYLRAGVKRYEGGKYKEALAAFKRGAEHKQLPEFHYQLGQCFRQLGDGENATKEYRAYLTEVPDAPEKNEVEGFIAAGGGAATPPGTEPVAQKTAAAAASPTKEPATPFPAANQIEKCTSGKFVTIATNGHCCWPEQVWSDDNNVCIGIPKCGTGWKVRGTECIRVAGAAGATARAGTCPAGKVGNEGHCCWPEQVWVDEGSLCIGTPRCPSGYQLRGKECFKRAEEEE